MSFIAKDSGGGDFKKVPAGVHIGRCFKLIDLGTQEETYEGETKLLPKVCVYWELSGEEEDGTPLMDHEGNPMVIWQEYTMSLGKKAKLRAALESWRGRQFTDEELKGFDVSKLIGAYCMVNVTHKTSQASGKTYAQVSSLTPLPAALRNNKPPAHYSNVVFSVDAFDQKVFDTFHDKLKERINASLERRGVSRADASQSASAFDDVPPPTDDDIPF